MDTLGVPGHTCGPVASYEIHSFDAMNSTYFEFGRPDILTPKGNVKIVQSLGRIKGGNPFPARSF